MTTNEASIEVTRREVISTHHFGSTFLETPREVESCWVQVKDARGYPVSATFLIPTELLPSEMYIRTDIRVTTYSYPAAFTVTIDGADFDRILTVLSPILLALAPLQSPI